MTTLVLPDEISQKLLEFLRLDVETGAVLLVRPARTPSGATRLLAVDLVPVPEHAYEHRTALELRVGSGGFVPPLGRAEQIGAVAFWVHTHPGEGASPTPSGRDHIVDEQLGPLFRHRTGSPYYGSLILSPYRGAMRFSGRLTSESDERPIDRIWSVGARFELALSDTPDEPVLDPIFDRNIRAFGGGVQRTLNELCAAIVGCGGTGSVIAEQLVRLGVRRFLLIDPDEMSGSNLTRVYGSHPRDIARPKVEVLGDHLRSIATGVDVVMLSLKVTMERAARALMDADVIFGCTDDNAGRLVLSRFSTYFLTPVIDCGVVLTTDSEGRLDGIHGRVTVLHPGAACMVCRDRIDLRRAASEALAPAEHVRRVDEGYAPALPGIEPAVIAFTTAVGAQAVSELLERLTRYGPTPVPNEVLLRLHEREISTNIAEPRERHYCHAASGKLGLADTEPFLEQTWAT